MFAQFYSQLLTFVHSSSEIMEFGTYKMHILSITCSTLCYPHFNSRVQTAEWVPMGLLVMATTAVIGPPHVLVLELIKHCGWFRGLSHRPIDFFLESLLYIEGNNSNLLPGENKFPAAAVTDQEVKCWPLALCSQTYNSVGASSEWR